MPLMTRPRAAAAATAGIAAVLAGVGLVAANADDLTVGPLSDVPALTCPAAGRVVHPLDSADQTYFTSLGPAGVANAYAKSTDGWTKTAFDPAFTTERPVAGSSPRQMDIDLRDADMRLIAVYSAVESGDSWTLIRTVDCAAPPPATKPSRR